MVRELDTSNLLRTNRGIDWKNSIGRTCNFTYDDICSTITILDYKKQRVKIQYDEKTKWMKTDSVLYARFGTLVGKINYDYIYDIGETLIRREKTVTIVDRKTEIINNKKFRYYEILCDNCQSKHWIVESQLKAGYGCPYCSKNSPKVFQGVNDIATTDPWMVKYFYNPNEAKKYRKTSKHKITTICPICHKIQPKQRPIKDIYKQCGCGCSCENKMSFAEMVICNLFDQFHIKYIKELSKRYFDWVGKYRYDFYLQDFNSIVEVHGIQHYKQTPLNNFNLSEQQKRDNIKLHNALNNGITNYFVIDCSDPSISNIIKNSKAIGLFDYLNINIDDVDISNLRYNKLMNEIQKCKNIIQKNPDIKYADLMKQCNLKHHYDLDRILDILGIKISHNNIPVYVYDDNKLVATYPSKSAYCRDHNEYNLASITSLNKYIDSKNKYRDRYIFASTLIDLSHDDTLPIQGELVKS